MNKQVLVGLQRKTGDAFYTKPDLALTLIKKLKNLYDIDDFDFVVEPSAGKGSFSDYFKEHKFPITAFNINPQQKYIKKRNFLKIDINPYLNKKVLVIGNPPFGRQSTLAKQFIVKSSEFATVIAFILPKSFKKNSFKQIFPPNFHLMKSYQIPKKSFCIENEEYDVPCVFQIWEKKDFDRKKIKKEYSKYFSFTSKDNSPTLAIRRIGFYAGKLDNKNIDDLSEQSHYFIKLKNKISKKNFIKQYNNTIKFVFDNTVGPRSISKPEVIHETNKLNL